MRRSYGMKLLAALPLLFVLTQGDCLSAPAENAPPASPGSEARAQPDQPSRSPARAQQGLARRIQRELRMLPFYSVFDWLEFRVDGYQVTLSGYTIRPTPKKDAEAAVKRIEGIEKVVNRIEVLPLSGHDDQLRRALYRTLYSQAALQKYAGGTDPSIHIIVKRGHVTLEGVVLNEGDKNIAGITAHTVPGSFSVTNNLRTES
ncbi:MAG: BON domain-containing protein [Acidobacteria bacterium]|nr:BON domain-containing protein [Acidobacteriota bacterium]